MLEPRSIAAISERFLGLECGMFRKSRSITAPSCHDPCLPPTRSCSGPGNTRYYSCYMAHGYLIDVIVLSLPPRSLPLYRATLRVACRSERSASGLESAAWHRFVTQSVTQGIPTLEREER
ncbi:hypothetical protein ALQ08_04158 [Pseudomonas syringae pv. delphinii]|uniref:Uncharacterized protein n=1 Tax=Pseudomonas syringae pv. delphinii TaxID=192088 RepID=A0A3M4KL32_9PSED|nr:hypothetical protein ALQ08_04158 [Pseudomonas syringae pv. delphinii]